MANKVRLTICGSSYVISTNESEDYMQNLAERLNLDMNELMSSSNSVSITTAAIMTALNYRDELEKASGSADNMRRQIKDYLEDAASAKMAAEEARRDILGWMATMRGAALGTLTLMPCAKPSVFVMPAGLRCM